MRKLFLDIETNGVEGRTGELLLAGYALDDGPVSVLWPEDQAEITDEWLQLVGLLEDPEVMTVSHTPFDVRFFREMGYLVEGSYIDTSVMAWVLNENTPLDLDWLTWKYADVDMDKRLRRSGGHVYFEDSKGVRHDLAEWRDWYDGAAGVWLEFERYNVRDVEALRKLFLELEQRLDESEWTPYWLREEVPYTRVLVDMEQRGMPIDLDAVAALTPVVEEEADRTRRELLAEACLPETFNLNSQKQLVSYLFSRVAFLADTLVYDKETIQCLKSCLDGEHEDCEASDDPSFPWDWHAVDGLPEGFELEKLGRDRVHGHWVVKGRGLKPTPPTLNKVTGEKGKLPSTSSPELLYMHAGDPWVQKLCLKYRKAEKLLTTYLRKFPLIAHEGRIYGTFKQTGTVTGRLSSASPNMQNMPARGERGKQVRGLFVAPENKVLVIGDYDQLEMRIMASLSEDPRLLKVFRNGEDPHLMTAEGIFGVVEPDSPERFIGKTLNYAMGYGAGPRKVAQTLSLLGYPTTPETAKGYLWEMEDFYDELFAWKEWLIKEAHRKGYVTTLGGRRRRLRGAFKDTANWKAVGYGERQAVNAVVQGTAADIIRRSMIEWDSRGIDTLVMLAQVHDEIVFEGDEGGTGPYLSTVEQVFTKAHGFELSVPLLFHPSVGKSWADKGAGVDVVELLLAEEEELVSQ